MKSIVTETCDGIGSAIILAWRAFASLPTAPRIIKRVVEQAYLGSYTSLPIVGILFLFSVGELLISPVGMALVTKLAPQNWKTQTVGVFFLSPAIGSALAGVIGQRYSPDNEVVYFGFLGVAAIVVGLLIAGAAKTLTRLMGGVR